MPSDVSVGDAVTAVCNAGGRGGTPSAAEGNVTATGQTMTASDDIQLARLKKRKLRLKDEIKQLEDITIPDIIA